MKTKNENHQNTRHIILHTSHRTEVPAYFTSTQASILALRLAGISGGGGRGSLNATLTES